MKYSVLASGSKGNSCLIETQNTKVLIDCGTTKKYLVNALLDCKTCIDELDALIVTHSHSDHISQLKHFSQIPKYAPYDIGDNELIIPHQSFQIGDLTFYPIELSHDVDIVVGFVITHQEEKLVYITDTGYIKEEDFKHCYNADYIVLESNYDPNLLLNSRRPYLTKMRIMSDKGHLSNDKCGYYLSQIVTSNTKEIVLAHISQEANTPEIAIKTVKGYLDDIYYSKSLVAAPQFEIIRGGSLV